MPTRPPVSAEDEGDLVPLTHVQKVIARRMTEAKTTMPEFSLSVDADMEAAAEVRDQVKGYGCAVPSFNDLVVKACALALVEHPRANGSYRDGSFLLHRHVNVGVAVAAPDALVVPVISDADHKSLARDRSRVPPPGRPRAGRRVDSG